MMEQVIMLLGLLSLVGLISPVDANSEILAGTWWKDYLSSEEGNEWFDAWNPLMQARIDELVQIAESREDTTEYFRVMMVGDSTMEHQYGTICSFLGQREGRRFDPDEPQERTPGCCVDTAEGGGGGLCFDYTWFRFLDPKTTARQKVDAYYFGSGLHLFHMAPSAPLEPMKILMWLHYEDLLEANIEALRETNPDVRIVFMTNHIASEQLFTNERATVRDAYRLGEGNSTIRAECEDQVEEVAVAEYVDLHYYDWRSKPDIEEYIQGVPEGEFTVKTYCEEALSDGHGCRQLVRRAKPVLARLGVPIVDAAQITDGQAWASRRGDGCHYHPLVPMEIFALLGALVSPPPPPLLPASDVTASRGDESGDGPHLVLLGTECGEP